MVGSAVLTPLLLELWLSVTGVLTAVIGLWMLEASPAMRAALRARFPASK